MKIPAVSNRWPSDRRDGPQSSPRSMRLGGVRAHGRTVRASLMRTRGTLPRPGGNWVLLLTWTPAGRIYRGDWSIIDRLGTAAVGQRSWFVPSPPLPLTSHALPRGRCHSQLGTPRYLWPSGATSPACQCGCVYHSKVLPHRFWVPTLRNLLEYSTPPS